MANKTGKPFLPTLNGIRSALEGHVRGQDIAEAFDQIANAIGDLNTTTAGVAATVNNFVSSSTTSSSAATPNQTPNPESFDQITTGINIQADMEVSSGATLEYDQTPGATGVV